MRRRKYWISGAVIALAGFVALCVYLSRPYPPGPGVTWANVERIEVGMTQTEVETVVGRPPQTWSPGSISVTANSPPGYHAVLLWSDMECDILVYLDENGRVIGREGVGSAGSTQSAWYRRLRQRLGV
jgi:uncharacterized protein YuzE